MTFGFKPDTAVSHLFYSTLAYAMLVGCRKAYMAKKEHLP